MHAIVCVCIAPHPVTQMNGYRLTSRATRVANKRQILEFIGRCNNRCRRNVPQNAKGTVIVTGIIASAGRSSMVIDECRVINRKATAECYVNREGNREI